MTEVTTQALHLNLDAILGDNLEHDVYSKGHFRLAHRANVILAGNGFESDGKTIYWHYSIGGFTAEGSGRKVTGGPIVQGPFAYMWQCPVTVSNSPSLEPEEILIEFGMTIQIGGAIYKVVEEAGDWGYRRDSFALQLVE